MDAQTQSLVSSFLLLAGAAWRLFVFSPSPRIAWSLPK